MNETKRNAMPRIEPISDGPHKYYCECPNPDCGWSGVAVPGSKCGKCGKASVKPSDRTDESLVRTMAEWMGLVNRMWTADELLLVREASREYLFSPHKNSADRERVMLAMDGVDFSFSPPNKQRGYDVAITDDTKPRAAEHYFSSTHNPTLGRAFCEAVARWIEAQEGTSKQ